MSAPTKEQAREAMAEIVQLLDTHDGTWKLLKDYLGWKKYELALSVLSDGDGATRLTKHGMVKMCDELLKLKPLQTP